MARFVSILAITAAMACASAAPAQTPPPDATEVVIKGVLRAKPAPTDPLPPLDIFTKAARIEQIAISPDGSQVAFTTHVEGSHLMAVYRVADDSKRAIKLGDDRLTAISWMDNDHILLSASQTGLRGTCPATSNQYKADNDTKMSLVQGGDGATLALLNSLRTPGCAFYGVRSEEAVTVFNLKTDTGTRIGDKMSELNNLALGVPKTVMIDGKPNLMGPFLELRLDSINRQPLQRVYLWRTDPETGRGKLIDDGGGDLDREARYVDDWLFDGQGVPFARTSYDFIKETFSIQIRDGQNSGSKAWKPILTRKIGDRELTLAPYLVGLGRDGKAIVIFDKDTATGLYHYYELSPDGTLSAALEPDDARRDRPIFDPATGRLGGFVSDGETPDYRLSDPGLAKIYAAAQEAAPAQAVRIVDTARDPRRMIIFTQGSDDAGGYFYLDMVKGSFVDLGNDHADIPAEWIATQSPMTYTAADGLEIHALLTYPTRADNKNLPLIVLPHDGPEGHDAIGYNWLAQVLASRGYLVLQPNYRGSEGNGQAFVDAGNGQYGGKMLSDMAAGVNDLVAHGVADPKRVCIVGAGFGGYAALSGAVAGDGTYACAAAIGGVSDVADYTAWIRINRPLVDPDRIGGLEVDPTWPRAFRQAANSQATLLRYIGDADRALISPIGKVNAAVPVMLIHGDKDTAVPASQSRRMRDALQKAGKAVDYSELKGCDHDLTTDTCRLQTAEAVVAFLGKYNPAQQ